jgi:hypothetical protein
MSSVEGLNNCNNLLYATDKRAINNILEQRARRVGMDLRYKGYSRTDEF